MEKEKVEKLKTQIDEKRLEALRSAEKRLKKDHKKWRQPFKYHK